MIFFFFFGNTTTQKFLLHFCDATISREAVLPFLMQWLCCYHNISVLLKLQSAQLNDQCFEIFILHVLTVLTATFNTC